MEKKLIAGPSFQNSTHFNVHEFNRMLEAAYIKQARPDQFKTKKSFSPSTIGYGYGTCPRYWFLAFTGGNFVEQVSSLSVAAMANGVATHERIQKVLEDTGILEDTEVKLEHQDPPIFGVADIIINWKGERVVGEIKSANVDAFQFRVSSGKPTDYHYVQLLIYMYVLDLKEGFLLYENKSTHQLYTIAIGMTPRRQEQIEEVMAWMREVRKAYDDDKMPARPFTRRSKFCKGCPLVDDCWDNEKDTENKIEPLKVPKP